MLLARNNLKTKRSLQRFMSITDKSFSTSLLKVSVFHLWKKRIFLGVAVLRSCSYEDEKLYNGLVNVSALVSSLPPCALSLTKYLIFTETLWRWYFHPHFQMGKLKPRKIQVSCLKPHNNVSEKDSNPGNFIIEKQKSLAISNGWKNLSL